jgi:hypothetical protein
MFVFSKVRYKQRQTKRKHEKRNAGSIGISGFSYLVTMRFRLVDHFVSSKPKFRFFRWNIVSSPNVNDLSRDPATVRFRSIAEILLRGIRRCVAADRELDGEAVSASLPSSRHCLANFFSSDYYPLPRLIG